MYFAYDKKWSFKKTLFPVLSFLISVWFVGGFRPVVLLKIYSKQMPEGEFFIGGFSIWVLVYPVTEAGFCDEGVRPLFPCTSLTDVLPLWMNHHAMTSEPTRVRLAVGLQMCPCLPLVPSLTWLNRSACLCCSWGQASSCSSPSSSSSAFEVPHVPQGLPGLAFLGVQPCLRVAVGLVSSDTEAVVWSEKTSMFVFTHAGFNLGLVPYLSLGVFSPSPRDGSSSFVYSGAVTPASLLELFFLAPWVFPV